MTLLNFIWRTCRRMTLLTTAIALVSGACNAALIALVTMALSSPNQRGPVLLWSFIAVGSGSQSFLAWWIANIIMMFCIRSGLG